MIEPRGWEVLENLKNPICPLISALTVKQANKYIECVKEKCMWWSKCKGLEAQRPHGEWTSNGIDIETICSVCGEALPYSDEYDYETNFCPHCGASMVKKEGESE